LFDACFKIAFYFIPSKCNNQKNTNIKSIGKYILKISVARPVKYISKSNGFNIYSMIEHYFKSGNSVENELFVSDSNGDVSLSSIIKITHLYDVQIILTACTYVGCRKQETRNCERAVRGRLQHRHLIASSM